MFGQTAAATMGIQQATERLIAMTLTSFGQPREKARMVGKVLSVKISASAAGAIAVVTVDPIGAAGSAAYLALVIGDVEAPMRRRP